MANKGGGDVRALALDTLQAVCRDENAPAAARAAAARTLLEIEGAIGRHAVPPKPQDKPLSGMSRAELIADLAAMRANGAAQIG